jgi:hypothetical protein
MSGGRRLTQSRSGIRLGLAQVAPLGRTRVAPLAELAWLYMAELELAPLGRTGVALIGRSVTANASGVNTDHARVEHPKQKPADQRCRETTASASTRIRA